MIDSRKRKNNVRVTMKKETYHGILDQEFAAGFPDVLLLPSLFSC